MIKSKKQKRRRSSSFNLETFLINYGLQTAGILLIAGGLIYLANSNFNARFLDELWNSLINSSSGKSYNTSYTKTGSSGYLSLLLFIPGILLIGLAHVLQGNKTSVKNILVSLGFIWLIVCQGKILLDIRHHYIELNYYLVLVSFGSILAFATTLSIAGKNRLALNWSILYFFASVFFIRLIYGVIFPNIMLLILLQATVSLACYIFKWRSPFILLMTLSFVYISYYFIKLVILPADADANLTFMLPALLVWFVLSVTGFGILKPDSGSKLATFIWNQLPYVTLLVVTGLTMGYYFKAGLNYLFFLYYALAVSALISITFVNRKYSFITFGDPFYLSLSIFSAFLLPQLFYSGFFLILSASLAIALLISVKLTDLKISFRFSMGLFFISLLIFMAEWIVRIIPALISQRATGTIYPWQFLTGSLMLFALAWVYFRLFNHTLKDYAFSYTQNKRYSNSVRLAFISILYLTVFLFLNYLLLLIVPGYRVNFIEWGFYTYSLLYFLIRSQNSSSRGKLLYIFLLLPAVFLYPAVIHPETIHFRTLYLAGETYALLPFIMHYFCLGVMTLIILKINGRLGKLYPKNRFLTNGRMLLAIIFLCFFLLSEYDHTILLLMTRFSTGPAYEILQYNKFIPYSVILLLVSAALLAFSLIRYTRFLRRLSMLMILAVLLKVLFIDIAILPANTGIILLISLGAVLVALSFLIPRFRKQSPLTKSP